MYQRRSGLEWAFIGTTAGQAACITVFDLIILIKYLSWVKPVVYQVPLSYIIPVTFGVFVFGNLYQAILAFDGVRAKNNLQLFGICVFNICLFVFSALRYGQLSDAVARLRVGYAGYITDNLPFVDRSIDLWPVAQPLLLASTILVGISSITLSAIAFQLHRKFAWAIYRHINGSQEIRRRYHVYQVLLVLMKLEVNFLIGFVIVYGFINVHYELPEFPLTMAVVPLVLMQVALTVYSIKTEKKLEATVAIIIRLGEIAYLLSRIIVLCGHGRRGNTPLKDEMLLYAGVSLAFATLICLNSILCMANFGRGLKPLLLHPGWRRRSSCAFEPVHNHNQAYLMERFDLD